MFKSNQTCLDGINMVWVSFFDQLTSYVVFGGPSVGVGSITWSSFVEATRLLTIFILSYMFINTFFNITILGPIFHNYICFNLKLIDPGSSFYIWRSLFPSKLFAFRLHRLFKHSVRLLCIWLVLCSLSTYFWSPRFFIFRWNCIIFTVSYHIVWYYIISYDTRVKGGILEFLSIWTRYSMVIVTFL